VKDTRRGEVLYHTGSAGGYKAFTLRHPGLEVSIVVLSNAGDAAVGKISPLRILDLFVPGPSGPGESR
jgi:esterase/lipase superfamily enzyme